MAAWAAARADREGLDEGEATAQAVFEAAGPVETVTMVLADREGLDEGKVATAQAAEAWVAVMARVVVSWGWAVWAAVLRVVAI